MGLGKRDLDRKKKSLERNLEELEEKARKNPLNKSLQEEIKEMKKKIPPK
jgi:DNA-binding transcriptional regulator GbsR (MarR family)